MAITLSFNLSSFDKRVDEMDDFKDGSEVVKYKIMAIIIIVRRVADKKF